MQKTIWIGVDPGVTGAFAITDGTEVAAFKWPGSANVVCEELIKLKTRKTVVLAAVEHVHATPQQGRTSVFTFGTNFGEWKGILAALQIPYIMVPPGIWYKNIMDLKKAKSDKPSVDFVNRRFPGIGFRKSQHNETDAICLALYAYSQSNYNVNDRKVRQVPGSAARAAA